MGKERGTLIRWDNAKGFGFIRPDLGNKDVFLHAAAIPHYQRRPKIGDVLTFAIEVDERGRYSATSTKIKGLAWSAFTLVWGCLILLFGIYGYLAFQQVLPFNPISIYVAMSLMTIWAYSSDKRAAQLGSWRIPEIKLHALEALGGWPGALLAQIFYRHKIRKIAYQIVFWLIVLSHGILWYQIFAHQEQYRPYQRMVTDKVQPLMHNGKQLVVRLLDGDNSGIASKEENSAQSMAKITTSRTDHRSLITPSKQMIITQGTIEEIRPDEGVLVSLKSGTKGMINKSTLVSNFPTRFKKKEHVRVAVQTITARGNANRIDLLLVDE